MFTLFVLLSVASAAEYIFKEYPDSTYGRSAAVYILNQCYNYKINDADVSMKLTYQGGKVYRNAYTQKDCQGNPETAEDNSHFSGFKYTTELPRHKFYRVDDELSTECTYIDGSLKHVIIYDECFDVKYPTDNGAKSKRYEVNGGNVVLQGYENVGCSGGKKDATNETPLNTCLKAGVEGTTQTSMKIKSGSLEAQPTETECNYFFIFDPDLSEVAVSGMALNECYSYVDNYNNELSLKATINENRYTVYSYSSKDCTGTSISYSENIPAEYKCAKNLPDYIFKMTQNKESDTCTTNDKSIWFKLLKDTCLNEDDKSYKWILNDDVVYLQEYSGKNCQEGKETYPEDKPEMIQCGFCYSETETKNGQEIEIGNKYVCNPAKQTPDATCKYLVETSEQEPEIARVEEMDKCYNYKIEKEDVSMKYTRVGNKRLVRYFSGKDCKVENIEVEGTELEGSEEHKKCAAELPAYVIKGFSDPFSKTCATADEEMPRFILLLEHCEKQTGVNIYVKNVVVDGRIVQKPYSDAECKTEIKDKVLETGDAIACNKCVEDGDGSMKFVCAEEIESSGSVAMTILAFFMIIAFLF